MDNATVLELDATQGELRPLLDDSPYEPGLQLEVDAGGARVLVVKTPAAPHMLKTDDHESDVNESKKPKSEMQKIIEAAKKRRQKAWRKLAPDGQTRDLQLQFVPLPASPFVAKTDDNDNEGSPMPRQNAKVVVDGSQITPMDTMWKRCVGTGHAALWSRADWRAHLAKVKQDCGFEMIRGHGILDNQVMFYDGADANVNGKSENQSSYFDAFSAFDYLLSVGVKPLVELSFTPDPLNKAWTPGLPVPPVCNHFHYNGCETFPTNLTRYTEYIHDFVAALLAHYGPEEVSTWMFEVYNEADLHWSASGNHFRHFPRVCFAANFCV